MFTALQYMLGCWHPKAFLPYGVCSFKAGPAPVRVSIYKHTGRLFWSAMTAKDLFNIGLFLLKLTHASSHPPVVVDPSVFRSRTPFCLEFLRGFWKVYSFLFIFLKIWLKASCFSYVYFLIQTKIGFSV